jgi:hypothetical protein
MRECSRSSVPRALSRRSGSQTPRLGRCAGGSLIALASFGPARRFRNQAHAILIRNLASVSATDAFRKRGRRELAEVRLPVDEREQLESTLRLHDAIDAELVDVERGLSRQALESPGVRRLITIPGIGAVTALGLLALVGDVERFATPRQLVSYLGLDPRVRQSGERPARMGHISRQGQAHARSLLIEASIAAIKTPGPLRGFHTPDPLTARLSGRDGRHRTQAGRPDLAPAHQRRGLPPRSADRHAPQATRPREASRRDQEPDQPRRRHRAEEGRAALARTGRAPLLPGGRTSISALTFSSALDRWAVWSGGKDQCPCHRRRPIRSSSSETPSRWRARRRSRSRSSPLSSGSRRSRLGTGSSRHCSTPVSAAMD